uniref:Uncharacterized protein n=1 Tax=Molossus molossus TaxID=27622 RepID=A0A7J8CRW8_MOLMO|nr:hypothetical protein HJG59_009730 [Molossus molossus]
MYRPLAFYHNCSVTMTTELTISLISLRKDTYFCTSELDLGLHLHFRVSGQSVYLFSTPPPILLMASTAYLQQNFVFLKLNVSRLHWFGCFQVCRVVRWAPDPERGGGRKSRAEDTALVTGKAPVHCHFFGAPHGEPVVL